LSEEKGHLDLRIVDMSDCARVVTLDDPGEQDASQYVVVPRLANEKDLGCRLARPSPRRLVVRGRHPASLMEQ
jgi:hypothetical protein